MIGEIKTFYDFNWARYKNHALLHMTFNWDYDLFHKKMKQ